MKQKLVLICLVLLVSLTVFCQTKKPTLMILPSDNWCNQRYFMTTFSNQGSTVKVPNYQQAFMEDTELPQVISKVGGVLTELGYSLKDAEQTIKTLAIKTAEDNVTSSKTSGASLAESPLDVLKRRIKSDIVIQIGWNINNEAKGHSVSFTLEAFDAYTNKRIATSTGTSKASKKIIPVLLEQTVKEHIEPFDRQLDTGQYFGQALRQKETGCPEDGTASLNNQTCKYYLSTRTLKTIGSVSPSMTCTRHTPRSHSVNVSVGAAATRLAIMRPLAS